ncbi:enoyl-CoA hydratase-related protein [Simiduia sp. 21SJ11W-1]|uniref:enoyl-CoA hydratase/isomerase family protein n=1 Tax=Simiduia sp. 21SJ11W-1 TaxID=2909669 RepID=UPI0020A186B8|nr:enoyl-CoA hydratase-related protein [Simiduia sp. 21SJ11W-1]UTA46411.1 enoyl-CoA hydratase-related protein [Simiduia sp. 21SJ11W-1]
MQLPTFEHVKIEKNLCGITVTLNRPHLRNAINHAMLRELTDICTWLGAQPDLRVLVIKGADGHFCAGGDIADMLSAAEAFEAGNKDAFYTLNLNYGQLLLNLARLPCTVISVLQGTVMGGGLGLCAVADICLADASAKLAMPEITLGLPPAQIAAFVGEKIGLAQARRLAVSAGRLTAQQAKAIGLVDEAYADSTALTEALNAHLAAMNLCSPKALRTTKSLLLAQGPFSHANEEHCQALLARAANAFSDAVTHGDGPEGTKAFMEKRRPHWVQTIEPEVRS